MIISRMILMPQPGRMLVFVDGLVHREVRFGGADNRWHKLKRGERRLKDAQVELSRRDSYDRLTITHRNDGYVRDRTVDLSVAVAGCLIPGFVVLQDQIVLTLHMTSSFAAEPLRGFFDPPLEDGTAERTLAGSMRLGMLPIFPNTLEVSRTILEMPAEEEIWTLSTALVIPSVPLESCVPISPTGSDGA